MKKFWQPFILIAACLFGCAASQEVSHSADSMPGAANDFNPYLHKELPSLRPLSADGKQMLGQMGGKAQTIQGETKYRKNWREEVYPVVFGNRQASHEIIALLNYSNPQSAAVWQDVVTASKSLSPKDCKIVVLAKSDENYGTDLMGFAIWLLNNRKNQAMPWLTYSLQRWNEAKAAQKNAGKLKKFTNEYDAVAKAQDLPILHAYLARLNPPLPANQEVAVSRYAYDAGNVNMYQATQVSQYYGVESLPAVIVDGKVLSKVSPEAILAALGQ